MPIQSIPEEIPESDNHPLAADADNSINNVEFTMEQIHDYATFLEQSRQSGIPIEVYAAMTETLGRMILQSSDEIKKKFKIQTVSTKEELLDSVYAAYYAPYVDLTANHEAMLRRCIENKKRRLMKSQQDSISLQDNTQHKPPHPCFVY